MIKNIHVNDMVFSNLLVKPPVDSINKKISNNSGNKIILASGRGSGKSIVLGSRVMESIGTETPAFLTSFDAARLFSKNNPYFQEDIIEHYYEVVMAWKFLDYVKKYYPIAFYSKFQSLTKDISAKLEEIDKYINDVSYVDVEITELLTNGKMTEEMLSLFKKETAAKEVTLMIDRFDWTQGSDDRVQNILKKYFDKFDNVIVTSDDSNIITNEGKEALKTRGYDVIDSGYSYDVDAIMDIVFRRFMFDQKSEKRFPVEKVSKEDYLKLIDMSDGNISTILDSFSYAENLYRWDNKKDISTLLDESGREKVNEVKQLRKISISPKLYL